MTDWHMWAATHIALSCLLLVVALLRGAAPERVLAGTLLGSALLLWTCNHLHFLQPTFAIGTAFVCGDGIVSAVILAVALYANRVYPIYLGAVQLVMLIAHCWSMQLGGGSSFAYSLVVLAGFDLQLVILTGGLASHVRRIRDLGRSYPAWTTSSR